MGKRKKIDLEHIAWLASEGYPIEAILRDQGLKDLLGKDLALVKEAVEKGRKILPGKGEENGVGTPQWLEREQKQNDLIEVQMLAAEGLSRDEVINEMALESDYFEEEEFETAFGKGEIGHGAEISRAITAAARKGVPSAIKALEKRRDRDEEEEAGEVVDGLPFNMLQIVWDEEGGVGSYQCTSQGGVVVRWSVNRKGEKTTLTLEEGPDPTDPKGEHGYFTRGEA